MILEGSYSHHPLLRLRNAAGVCDLHQGRADPALTGAEGARYADFAARWVPLEEGYFAQYGIAESADFVVETTQGGTI
ncbi:MAG: hypothetical protein ACLVJH_17230 [Faecalibacterium prausnitzii]